VGEGIARFLILAKENARLRACVSTGTDAQAKRATSAKTSSTWR
jgi:hypothetical protein